MYGDASITGRSRLLESSGKEYSPLSCSVITGSGAVTVPLYAVPLARTLSKIPQLVTRADTTFAHSGALLSTVIEPFPTGAI